MPRPPDAAKITMLQWLSSMLAIWNSSGRGGLLSQSAKRYMVVPTNHVEIELSGPYDQGLMQVLHGLRVPPSQDPHLVYLRLLERGATHYATLRKPLPLDFSKNVLAAMFTAPWTTEAYMEYVLDVFE